MREQNYSGVRNLYAYSYDYLNDAYLIRGIDSDYLPNPIDHIPEGLIEDLVFEEYIKNNRIVNVKDSKGIVSYSNSRCYAVIDFNGRHFTHQQVMDVVFGNKVEIETDEKESLVDYSYVETDKGKSLVKRLISRFTR